MPAAADGIGELSADPDPGAGRKAGGDQRNFTVQGVPAPTALDRTFGR